MNEYFDRKNIPDVQIQLILSFLLSARFKIIELIALLQTDTIIKVKDVIETEKKG